jgi:hypothetical protein
MSTWFPRLLGAATAAYGTAVTINPGFLAGPAGLAENGTTPRGTAVACRAVGIRDLISGAAMTGAKSPAALRTAIAIRAASDLGDAAVLGTSLPDKQARRRVGAVALSWGLLCGLSAATLKRR